MRIVLAAAVITLVLAGGAGAQSPTLFATVGPGFNIKLADSTGVTVSHLDPGTYTIQVDDKGDIHNFHLTGPGVDKATDIEQTGTFTWTVTFVDGRYHYQCDAHATQMNGDFTVGNPPPPPTTTTAPPPPAPKPAALRLAGSVGPGKTIALRRPGAKVRVAAVKAGVAVIVVSDRTAADNFHLTGPGVNKTTTKAGKGTFTWRLTLKKGVYRYRSDATPSLKGSFRAT
jgi:hypothetical protein